MIKIEGRFAMLAMVLVLLMGKAEGATRSCGAKLYLEFKSRTPGAMGTSSEKVHADNEYVATRKYTGGFDPKESARDLACEAAAEAARDTGKDKSIVKGLACRGATNKEFKLDEVYGWAAREKTKKKLTLNTLPPDLQGWVSCNGATITMQDVCDDRGYRNESALLTSRTNALLRAIEKKDKSAISKAFEELNWSRAPFIKLGEGNPTKYKPTWNCIKEKGWGE